MAGEKLLTDSRCKAAKRKEKIYYLNDGHGLRLRISPNGSRIRAAFANNSRLGII